MNSAYLKALEGTIRQCRERLNETPEGREELVRMDREEAAANMEDLTRAFRAGLAGDPMPPTPPDPAAAAIHRERAELYRRLAEVEEQLANLDEAGATC